MSSLEDIFGKLAMTTVSTVSRIAISHATNAAIRNVTSLITEKTQNKQESRELQSLQRQLDLKVKNLKPTIDIISRRVADGNSDLEPALEMCNDLKQEIDDFAAEMDDELGKKKQGGNTDYIVLRLKRLLANVDDVVPSLHLALRSLEASLGKPVISTSRLLQAAGIIDASKRGEPTRFALTLYSLFAANVRAPASAESPFTWKEEFHKCQLVLDQRKPFDYTLAIREDLDDGLYHEELETGKEDAVGRLLTLDIQNLKRMYYTRSGALLNIEDSKTPVLVFKVLKQKERKEEDHQQIKVKDAQPEIDRSELQDADYYAIQFWTEPEDEEEEEGDSGKKNSPSSNSKDQEASFPKTLLLLESVIQLSLLEVSEQMDYLNASDDLLALYMA
ncbi:hypothetical protein DFQ28_009642 [Apophysomyces sp. BC1034]|nr:hypothetical protein DFQ30_009389 [Apophysomyces sp. BC1015]KAG0172479.1 hypothetical protein DFQ29_008348 [Apophysomyces sp. BC1021]KAG0185253.1 hypothetical protein DFQ28_009642 [Apophysomyces sp. BC1034]